MLGRFTSLHSNKKIEILNGLGWVGLGQRKHTLVSISTKLPPLLSEMSFSN